VNSKDGVDFAMLFPLETTRKAGGPQELGLAVCVHKDQYGFILHHRVMQQQTDDKLAVVNITRKLLNFLIFFQICIHTISAI